MKVKYILLPFLIFMAALSVSCQTSRKSAIAEMEGMWNIEHANLERNSMNSFHSSEIKSINAVPKWIKHISQKFSYISKKAFTATSELTLMRVFKIKSKVNTIYDELSKDKFKAKQILLATHAKVNTFVKTLKNYANKKRLSQKRIDNAIKLVRKTEYETISIFAKYLSVNSPDFKTILANESITLKDINYTQKAHNLNRRKLFSFRKKEAKKLYNEIFSTTAKIATESHKFPVPKENIRDDSNVAMFIKEFRSIRRGKVPASQDREIEEQLNAVSVTGNVCDDDDHCDHHSNDLGFFFLLIMILLFPFLIPVFILYLIIEMILYMINN